MLEILNLSVKVENKEILRGISMSVNPGQIVAIMGPNGSGKSTLANALIGHFKYELVAGTQIELDKVSTVDKKTDERANLGLFLANQNPVAVPGLPTINFLWRVYKKKNEKVGSLIEFRKWMEKQAESLGLKPELLKRSLNDGFSGGEKKKLEVLQILVSNPKYVILDEIDSGLDVDAVKKIGLTIAKMAKDNKIGILLITHNARMFKYLSPDKVYVLKDGKVAEQGGLELIKNIEKKGFN